MKLKVLEQSKHSTNDFTCEIVCLLGNTMPGLKIGDKIVVDLHVDRGFPDGRDLSGQLIECDHIFPCNYIAQEIVLPGGGSSWTSRESLK